MLTGQESSVMLGQTNTVRRLTVALMITQYQAAVGARIRRRRRDLHMSPADFARAINVSGKTVERYERGETDGAIKNIDVIADALDIDRNELLTDPPDKSATPSPFPEGGGEEETPLGGIKAQLDALQTTVETELSELRTELGELAALITQRASEDS